MIFFSLKAPTCSNHAETVVKNLKTLKFILYFLQICNIRIFSSYKLVASSINYINMHSHIQLYKIMLYFLQIVTENKTHKYIVYVHKSINVIFKQIIFLSLLKTALFKHQAYFFNCIALMLNCLF